MAEVRERVVLFESGGEEEELTVVAEETGLGGFQIVQASAGDLTDWCFEETPHVVETSVGASGARKLCEHFEVDAVGQALRVLSMEFGDYDSARRVRGLLHDLGIAYGVVEHAIER